MKASLARRLGAEALGTGFLLAAIVGSGIMGERLANGNDALALLANSLATGCVLGVLIAVYAPISGAHFNPAVTLALASRRIVARRPAVFYVAVQIGAAYVGVAVAHLMFGEPLFLASVKVRTGFAQWTSEFVATFGLVMVIFGCLHRHTPAVTAFAVAAYITGAYWFTGSTSFANPAVTLARAATDTFAGIRPADVGGFLLAQFAGAATGATVMRRLGLPSDSPAFDRSAASLGLVEKHKT